MILRVRVTMLGKKFGFIKTTIEMALQNEELNVELMKYMKELVKREEVHS